MYLTEYLPDSDCDADIFMKWNTNQDKTGMEYDMKNHMKQEKLKVEVTNTTEEREHFHQDIELLFVLEGNLDVTVGEQDTHMKQEDILVINANKKHSFKASEDILLARLYITYQLISDIF